MCLYCAGENPAFGVLPLRDQVIDAVGMIDHRRILGAALAHQYRHTRLARRIVQLPIAAEALRHIGKGGTERSMSDTGANATRMKEVLLFSSLYCALSRILPP